MVNEFAPNDDVPAEGGFCQLVPLFEEYEILDDAPFDSEAAYWKVAVTLFSAVFAVTSQYFRI
jgi:hypothetical protein